jgi:cytochrome c
LQSTNRKFNFFWGKYMKKMLMFGYVAAITLATFPALEAQAGAEAKCKACHSFDAKNKVGPGLAGVYGNKAGTREGFKYSDSFKNASWTWDDEHLKEFLSDSKAAIKKFTGDDGAKTKMPPQKLKGDKLEEVITFLKGLK